LNAKTTFILGRREYATDAEYVTLPPLIHKCKICMHFENSTFVMLFDLDVHDFGDQVAPLDSYLLLLIGYFFWNLHINRQGRTRK
jgi:hypothetical protein